MLGARIEKPIGSKTLASSLLLVALVTASLLLASKPANAAKTFAVTNTPTTRGRGP